MSATANVLELTAGEVMTPRPITIRARRCSPSKRCKIMETHKITSVVVADATRRRRRRHAPPRSLADCRCSEAACRFRPKRARSPSAPLRRRRRAHRRHRRDARRRHRNRRAFTSATARRSCGRSAPGCRSACCRRARPAPPPIAPRSSAVRIVEQGVTSKLDGLRTDPARGAGSTTSRSPTWATISSICRCWRGSGCRPRRRMRRQKSASGSTGSARAGGGRGAVRELVELVLRAQQRWDDVAARSTSLRT